MSEELVLIEIKEWLNKSGYTYGPRSGPMGEEGYTKVFRIEFYNTWVTINIENKIINIYREYECGGEISKGTIRFSSKILIDVETFSSTINHKIKDYTN